EMDGQEAAAELHHLWTADRGLQPCAVMKCLVPIIDGRVIAAKRHFEVIVLLKLNDAALYFNVEAGCGWRSGARVGSRRQTQLAEEAYLRGERGVHVQHELAFVEAAMAARLISRGEIDIAEAGNMGGGHVHLWHAPAAHVNR